MRNHIMFKFLAILLCAASLLGAVAGGLGIFLLAESGLYQQTPEEAYADTLRSYAQGYADNAAIRYASRELGGASDDLLNSYLNSWYADVFDERHVGYSIMDEDGTVLIRQPFSGSLTHTFRFDASGNYWNVLSVTTEEEYHGTQVLPEGVTTQIGEDRVYDAIPEDGAEVYFLDIQYDDGHMEGIGAPGEPLGILHRNPDGTVEMLPLMDMGNMEQGRQPLGMTFYTWDRQPIYEVYSPEGVMDSAEWRQGVGLTILLRNLAEETMTFDAIPPEGCTVTSLYVEFADGLVESMGGSPDLGILGYDEDGNVCFTYHDSILPNYNNNRVTHIRFLKGETVLYEAKNPEGVGYFFQNDEQYLFRASTVSIPEASKPARGTIEQVSDQIPVVSTEGAKVYTVAVWMEDNQSVMHVESDKGALGEVFLNTDGFVEFHCDGLFGKAFETNYIQLCGENGDVLFESYDRSVEIGQGVTVGQFIYDEDGSLIFTNNLSYGVAPALEFTMEPIEESVAVTEETIEPTEETMEATESTEESVAVEATIPELSEEADEICRYHDHTTQQTMYAEVTHEPMPGYTVEVRLAEGAFRYEQDWVLIRLLYSLRKQLPYILGVSLLLFAVFTVYLCCAAGRKPGTKEIRAGGLNAMPLELYAAIAAGGVALLALAGVEGTEYLLRSDTQSGIFFAALCAYSASLLIVSFCFACAAQFKTPGGYWWRNCLVGRCLKLLVLCGRWLMGSGTPVVKKLGRGLGTVLVALFLFGKRFCIAAFDVAKRLWNWLWMQVKKYGRILGNALRRFYSLLPLTWQWLMTGFILVFLLYVALRSYKVGWVLLGFGLFFGVILYAASAFGILLENAKRMSKGDLDSKVEDKMLIGGFKDFAEELNGLADVAVVAAQKQLKSERMKTELITNVSHDIKTPLTSIINYVDLLQKPHTEQQQEQYLEVLDRQSQRLKKLIDDLMEMSKASTGNMAVDVMKVDAAEAVNQALGEFADKLEKAQLIPVFRQPEEPVYMMADGRLVWRVMSNLLSNAVKYALPGTRVYIDLQKVDSKVILSLKNISREELNVQTDELLERFVRGDASRNTEGSGLGLNIAKSLMELQKGQLQILVDGDLFKVTLIFPGV